MTTYATLVTLLLIFFFLRNLHLTDKYQSLINLLSDEAEQEIQKRDAKIRTLLDRICNGE